MSLRTLALPALLSTLAGLAGCSKLSGPGSSIGAPEPVGASGGSWATSSASPPASEGVASRGADHETSDASVSSAAAPMREKQSPGLGTAYGEQRFSSVRSVQFNRASPDVPTTVLSMRYNDAQGVDQMARWKTGGYPQRANHSSGPVSLTLRDEAGSPLPGAQVGGDLYAVGEAGARYTIGVENHSGYRYEVVASVDGLDVIDGADADFSKRGYLIDPYTSFVIEGWRTGDDTVAAFRFSDMDNSYAGRTGKARNIGVIGVAFFQEAGVVPADELRRRDSADPFPNRYAPPLPNHRAGGY